MKYKLHAAAIPNNRHFKNTIYVQKLLRERHFYPSGMNQNVILRKDGAEEKRTETDTHHCLT
jgi:hypothetical protein